MHASPVVPPHGPVRSVRKPLRPAVAALVVIALAASLAACGSRVAGASSSPVEKPDLTVAVVPATGAAGAYIAARDGYFTAAGLQVKIVAVTSSADALAGLADGAIDVDEGQWTSAFDAKVAGLHLHALAPGNSGGPGLEQLMIPGHSPVTTIRQLAGKTIAVNVLAGLPVLLTDMVLAENGILALTWGAAQDPRWAPVMAAVDAHVPDGTPGFEAFFRRPPFHDIAAVDQMLAAAAMNRSPPSPRGHHGLRHPGAVVGDVPVPGPRGGGLAAHPRRPPARCSL